MAGRGCVCCRVGAASWYAAGVWRWLGHTKMRVVLRLSAFSVLCIGVQIAWNGAKALIEELANPSEPAAMPFAPAAGK